MSKIFILSSNTSIDPYPVYPLGSAVIASALTAVGHQVRQLDYLVVGRSEDRLRNAITEFAPDFIGISIRNIDNVDSLTPESAWFLEKDKRLVDLIRQVTGVPIILGGPALSLLPEEISDYMGADYSVVGEGERVICELIQTLEEGHSAPRILNGGNRFLTGNEMCSPLWDEVLVNFYMERSGMVNFQTKRGCSYNCLYCNYRILEGNLFRPQDTKAVIDDIDRLKRFYGVGTIFFTDSVFNDAEGHYLKVAEELLSCGIGIRWSGFFRPQGISQKELALLKRSGLYAIEAGTDAGSDTALAELKKGFCFNDVIEFNNACVEEQIATAHYIMFGGPGETMGTVKEALRNIDKLKNCVIFAFSGIRIFPGTALYARAIQEGLLAEDAPLLRPVYYFSPHIAPQDMNEMIEKAFKGRREFIFPPSKGQSRIAIMNRFGYRGLLWDKLISFSKEKRSGK